MIKTTISEWKQKHPYGLFLLGFVLFILLFYLGMLSSFYNEILHPSIVHFNALVASGMLNIFGENTQASNDLISSSTYSISIKKGCDALLPLALFLSAVLAFPTKARLKWPGLLIGAIVILLVNLIRVVSLFLIGKYWPSMFDLAHLEIWQVLFLALAILCWLGWLQWSFKKQQTELERP